jgi:hypothetical protein
VPFFTHEVVICRGLMTTQACYSLRQIEDVVSSISDLCARLRDIQSEKLPTVGFGKFITLALHHCLKWNELQNGSDRILLVWHAVLKNAHCLFQLLGIRVLDARIPYLWPFADAVEAFLGASNLVGNYAGDHTDPKPRRKDAPTGHTSGKSAQPHDEMSHSQFPSFY